MWDQKQRKIATQTSCHYYSQSVSTSPTSPFLHSRRAHSRASRKSPRQSEHSVWFCSIQYLDTSALFDYHLRAKKNQNHSLTKKHFKNKYTQFCLVNENCDQSSVRLRQCVPGAACSTASVPSSNCLNFKSHMRVTPFEKLRCWTAWPTHGVRMAYGVRWTQVWYLTNGSCGEPLHASLHTQPMSSVQAELRLWVKHLRLFQSNLWHFLGLPGLWALGWWSGHVGTWLKRGSKMWLTTCMYTPYRPEHTYPIISLSSHIPDLFWSPGIYLDGQVQWSTTWSRRWRWRFNELPSWRSGKRG